MDAPHIGCIGTRRCQVGRDGCSQHRMHLGTRRFQVGSDGCSPHRMLLGTRRYQVGSHGCSSHRMHLGTRRCQVGSGGCTSNDRPRCSASSATCVAKSRDVWPPPRRRSPHMAHATWVAGLLRQRRLRRLCMLLKPCGKLLTCLALRP